MNTQRILPGLLVVGAALSAARPQPGLAQAPIGAPIIEANFIRPGQEGTFKVHQGTPRRAEPRAVGRLGGRELVEISTPVAVSSMGKFVAEDPAGYIWYLETREDKEVRIDPETLEMVEFQLPKGAAPYSLAIDARGAHWLTAHGIEMLLESYPEKGVVVAHQPPSHGFLIHINVDREGTVWFGQPGNNQIVSFHRERGWREFPIPTPQAGPGRIDFDSRGNVWVTELYQNKIAKLDPRTGRFEEWSLPTADALPAYLRVDAHDNVWVSEPMADKIALFRDGTWKEFGIPTANSVVSTTVEDEDGLIWFTEGGWRGSAGGNKIGTLDPRTGRVEELPLSPINSQPLGMIMDSRGHIWFEQSAAGKIGLLRRPGGARPGGLSSEPR